MILSNAGQDAQDLAIDGYSYALSGKSPGILLTGDSTAITTIYIFAGASAFGPGIVTQTGAILVASDLFFPADPDSAPWFTPAASTTVGLGHVTCGVGAVPPGVNQVSWLASPGLA